MRCIVFEYDFDKNTKNLLVNLPDKLEFNYSFLRRVSEMTKRINELKCEHLKVLCKENSEYDNLSKAYIFNILRQVSSRIDVKWNKELNTVITSTIHSKEGENFSDIEDIAKIILDKNLYYYRFHGDVGIDKPIEEISKLLISKNIVIDANEIKEFLSTTIGEIFSNSINHSEQDELFFMYDIESIAEDFYLCVNIVDYGTTIVDNVKKFFARVKSTVISSCESLKWAIQSGNTTREGSGGYGLPTLISYIKEVNGELYIFSGDAYYALKGEVERTASMEDGCFDGTSVTFKVKLFETSKAIKYDHDNDKVVSISLDDI